MSNTSLTGRNGSRISPCRGLHVGHRKNKQDRRNAVNLSRLEYKWETRLRFQSAIESKLSQVIYCWPAGGPLVGK